jgi:hypothetical protein
MTLTANGTMSHYIGTYTGSPANQIYFGLNFTVLADLPATDAILAGPLAVSNFIKIEQNRLRSLHCSTMRETVSIHTGNAGLQCGNSC